MDNNRSVLITGASTGIGKACAFHLDQLGFTVFAGVRKHEDRDIISNTGSDRLKPIILDVTNEETILNAIKIISSETDNTLFGLVNNAGIGISGVLEATPVEEFRKLLEVNVLGLHEVTKSFLPMLRQNKGRIVNVGSGSSFLAGPGTSSYAASKYAVRAITDSLRLELKHLGMHVSLVAPGAVQSAIWEKSKKYKEKLRKNAPEELKNIYELFVKAGDKIVDQIHPIPAIEVAKAVEHALTAKKPKMVYLVGKDAKMAYRFSKYSKNLTDWLMLKHIENIAKKSE